MKYILFLSTVLSVKFLSTRVEYNITSIEICSNEFTRDTTKIRTINDLIKRNQFTGLIFLDNLEIDYDNQFLFDSTVKDKIASIEMLKKPPLDSIRKYGIKANRGMLIITIR